MSKRVKQFRYINKNSPANYPDGLTYQNLTSGVAFQGCPSIIQLGIQALPGTKFYVNGGYSPVIIGTSGIYELDLNGLSEISSLYFNGDSIRAIEESDIATLLIDILYEDGEL